MKRFTVILVACGLAAAVVGCTDSSQQFEEKREMDRISFRNSSLQRKVDAQNDQISSLQSDLSAARRQIEQLQAQLNDARKPPATAPAVPSTTPSAP
jgi:uncharacterized protein YlxW (UPF0749 family)